MRCASFSGDSKRNADAVRWALPLALLLWLAPAISPAFAAEARFDIPQKSFLIDEVVPIVVSGVPPGSAVTIQLHGPEWESSGEFHADANGVVDLTKTADPMQLFW